MTRSMNNKTFYEGIASFYDEMTNWKNRIETEREIFRQLVKNYGWKKVLDLGCGTGAHLWLLEMERVYTIGVDLSLSMLKKATVHLQGSGLTPKLIAADINRLPFHKKKEFDGILCLGNTIPHLRKTSDLFRFFRQANSLLQPAGVMIVQLLNYHLILQKRQRLVNIKQGEDDAIYMRFYDFIGKMVRFNVLSISPELKVKWDSTLLRAWLPEELEPIAQRAGFQRIHWYGSLQWEPFDPNISNNVVLVMQM